MKDIRWPLILVVLITLPCGVAANEKFAGRWVRTSMKMSVSLESWGENCGPKPKGYSSGKALPVEIVSQGKHLVFTKGGLRTDRCHSPNPRLQSKSESITGSSWKRVCETAPDDSKFERGEYTLTAAGDNRLDYTARTKVDWTLKGDHCVAHLTESRVYEREKLDTNDPWTDKKPKPAAPSEPTEPTEPENEPQPGCENPGELVRLLVQPREAEIGPQEKVCLKAYGLDAGGCRFPVTASWTASQGGQEVGGLISRSGCFTAGATAADSEGSYSIEARAHGKSAAAEVTVSFPDLGDLLRARLDPTMELGEDPAVQPQAGDTSVPQVALPQPVAAQAPAGDDKTMLLVIILGAALVLATGLLVVILVIRRKSRYEEDDEWIDDEPPQAPPREDDPAREPEQASSAPSRQDAGSQLGMICPTCKSTFPAGARFCPADASKLVPQEEKEESTGMVCPKCHRGYDPGAKFCPHDAEKLITFPAWRSQRKGS